MFCLVEPMCSVLPPMGCTESEGTSYASSGFQQQQWSNTLPPNIHICSALSLFYLIIKHCIVVQVSALSELIYCPPPIEYGPVMCKQEL